MQQTFGKCPYCGKAISFFKYVPEEWKYGSPIRECKKCHQKYIDKRYHEIAVDGINPDSFNMKKLGACFAIGVVALLMSVLFNAYTILLKDYYYLKVVGVGLIGIVMIVYSIIDFIRIKTGAKERQLEKRIEESVNRLENRAYAHELVFLGYNVPEKYL